jgi:hypothetical protein
MPSAMVPVPPPQPPAFTPQGRMNVGLSSSDGLGASVPGGAGAAWVGLEGLAGSRADLGTSHTIC